MLPEPRKLRQKTTFLGIEILGGLLSRGLSQQSHFIHTVTSSVAPSVIFMENATLYCQCHQLVTRSAAMSSSVLLSKIC